MAQESASASPTEDTNQVSVFISYARVDHRTRQDLSESLVRDGFEVNGDWTLLQGPDFWEQVVQMIRQSDVFLALLSPAFAFSQVARREIEEAVTLGKRILPIVIEDIPDLNVLHPALRQPQWAFLRPGDPIDANRGFLVQAIRTDFADLKQHTDLLLAALRWLASNRDRGLTLRGTSLKHAGEWMTRAKMRPIDWFPKPTSLQEDFYRASLAAANRRKLIGAIAIAALIVIGFITILRVRSEQQAAQRAQEQRQALADQEASRQESRAAVARLPFQRDEAVPHVQKALGLWRT